jgi:uncharacterized protein (DUF983 family)
MNLSTAPSLGQILWRGLRRLCPACGQGSMFQGYLTPRDRCTFCQLTFAPYRSDDAPAYFTIALIGHIIMPLLFWTESHYHPEAWVHLTIWIPLTLILALGTLPFIKGIVMAVIWRTKGHST